MYTFRFYRLAKRDDKARDDRTDTRLGTPRDLDLTDEEAKDRFVATRLLQRPMAVMDQATMEDKFWKVIFKVIPAWCDSVSK